MSRRPISPLLAVILCGGALVYGTRDMPRVGDATAPAYVHPQTVVRYLKSIPDEQGNPGEVGVPNVVTTLLGDYRGYDTLGETTVIFTAAMCVVLLLRFGHATGGAGPVSGAPAPTPTPADERRGRRKGGA